MHKFHSKIHSIPAVDNTYSTDVIKNEPMLFSCDLANARNLGGPLTEVFCQALLQRFNDVPPDLIFDSRVHMLMPGWYPCIPGFHHDDVPRSRIDGQPNYATPEYRSQHCLMLLGGGSATEFALGEAEFPEIPLNDICYKVWHPLVVNKIKSGELISKTAEYGSLVYFDDRTWHQGVISTENSWRFFIRASWNTNRKPFNELRRQTQVYLANPMEGW